MNKPLKGKMVLVTGAAKRVGRIFALACGRAGADVILHHGHSPQQAEDVQKELAAIGCTSWILPSDLSNPEEASQLISRANQFGTLYGLVNSAAIFEDLSLQTTNLEAWERHLAINLTAPFLLSQSFAKQIPETGEGRIINILDWRALRPSTDHFPYTVSKAALAAMTKSLAVALAPRFSVNGLALGAILPPDEPSFSEVELMKKIPAQRWSTAEEAGNALLFLLTGSAYMTGEIIHLDGGRHLV